MIPYPYNMVDMGGIDLAEANGTVVEGLYSKIVEAVNACGDVVLYNWKFAGIEIAPQHTSILIGDPIIINGAVQVTEQDEVTVPGINPETIILPLSVNENGEYSAEDFDADGFDPVNVLIPSPVTTALEVTQNGVYTPPSGVVGFSSVSVDVSSGPSIIPNATRLTAYSEDNNTGYVAGNGWSAYGSGYADCRTDMYELDPEDGSTRNFLIFVASGGGNRFRICVIDQDPTSLPSGVPQTISGSYPSYHNPTNSANVSDGGAFTGGLYQVANITTKKYLCVGKTNANVDDIKSYVIDITSAP